MRKVDMQHRMLQGGCLAPLWVQPSWPSSSQQAPPWLDQPCHSSSLHSPSQRFRLRQSGSEAGIN